MDGWKKNASLTLEITGYTAEGMGVARWEGRVVFIPGTILGERWEVQLLKVKTNRRRSAWSWTAPWRDGAAAVSTGT